MSFNEEELLKIKKATSGIFKRKARAAVAAALVELKAKIDATNRLDKTERDAELKRLVKDATAERHAALQSGASSYGHPRWAAAAACESWLHELVLGGPEDIARVEALISERSKQ